MYEFLRFSMFGFRISNCKGWSFIYDNLLQIHTDFPSREVFTNSREITAVFHIPSKTRLLGMRNVLKWCKNTS